jgi:hypothetical protein
VRQGVDELLVRFVKVSDADNCADMFTKPIDHAKFCHLLSHTHKHAAQAKRREPVVKGFQRFQHCKVSPKLPVL